MEGCTKIVYVAGKYSDNNVLSVLHNIRKGINWSFECFKAGFAPFSPWLDYHYVLCDNEESLKVIDFQNYSMEFLRRSDILFVTPGSEESKGTIAEIKEAERLNIPVVYSFEDLLKWKILFD
jgi:hypothetical protein